MLDGLTIWLAMVGVATIAMFLFDALVWVFGLLREGFRRVISVSEHQVAGEPKTHKEKS